MVAIWGSTFVFTKMLLLAGLTPAQIFTLRFIIAYVLLVAYQLFFSGARGRGGAVARGHLQHSNNPRTSVPPHPRTPDKSNYPRTSELFCKSWRDELLMAALGLTGGSLYFLTENSSMNYTTTTNTSLIVSLSPLVATFLISLFYQSQRLNRVQIVGTLMAALGVVIVVLNGHFVLHLSPLGDSLAFGAALCWGFYSLLMIPAGQRYDTAFVTRKVFFYGLLSMIPYYMLRPEETWIFTSSVFQFFSSSDTTSIFQFFNSPILLNLLFLGCIASMGCFLAWNWVLKKLGAVVATNYVYFNPVTTIIFAWVLLSEQITLYFLLGTVLILVGMYLADRKR